MSKHCRWLGVSRKFPKLHRSSVDGKHVRLIQPSGSGSTDFCFKKYYSMVLWLCVIPVTGLFFTDIGSYGKVSDSSIYKNSVLLKKMQENTFKISDDRPVSVNGKSLPFVFIGDEAFLLPTHILRHRGKNLSQVKKTLNYRMSRARRYTECAFGILTNKWRIFHKPRDANVMNAETIIRVCCTLHNFVRERDGVYFGDTLNVIGLF